LGWMITISRAVYNGTETLAHLVGVIGIDIRLETITKTVGDISFLKSGYGFLIDNEGIIISHPDIIFDPSEEEYFSIQAVEPIDDNILDDMISLESDFALLVKEGKIYYLSYAPIPIAGYSLGIVVPQEEVLKTVYDLENSLNQRMRVQITTLIIIIAVVIVGVLIIGLRVANSVVKPIQKLTNLAMQLSTENIQKAALKIDSNFDADMQQDDEIGDLTRAFKKLVLSVQEDAKESKDHPET
jgi:methyl-accepting chemotaxis protein